MKKNPPRAPARSRARAAPKIDALVQTYGDLIFDLCDSVLWSTANAQIVFRTIIKDLRAQSSGETYREHEREWVLRVAGERLRAFAERHGSRLSPEEQIEIDASPAAETRLAKFDYYFRRLTPDEQILLLLKDKYSLPYAEIASATGIAPDSLKMRRQQALRTLEEWLWNAG